MVELSLRKEAQTISERNKHMEYEDRLEIRECLNKGMTFKSIGQRIGKGATTMSKEMKKHPENHRNAFVKTEEVYKKLLSAPYVCNGCEYSPRSSYPCLRRIYNAKHAKEEYQTVMYRVTSAAFSDLVQPFITLISGSLLVA